MDKFVSSPAINNRLYEVRIALGFTQVEMSDALGYSRSYFGKVEADANVKINKNVVLAVCWAFNVNYDYLVFGKGSMFNEADAQKQEIIKIYDSLPDVYKKFLYQYLQFLSEHSLSENAPLGNNN